MKLEDFRALYQELNRYYGESNFDNLPEDVQWARATKFGRLLEAIGAEGIDLNLVLGIESFMDREA